VHPWNPLSVGRKAKIILMYIGEIMRFFHLVFDEFIQKFGGFPSSIPCEVEGDSGRYSMKKKRKRNGQENAEEIIIPKVGMISHLDEKAAKRNMNHIKFKRKSADRLKRVDSLHKG